MKQQKYQSYIQQVGFAPEKAPSYAASMEREAARQNNLDAQALNQIRRNAQVEEANIVQRGKDLVALGQFNSKVLELGQTILKEKKENDQINETFDALFGEPVPDTPEEIQEDADLEELDRVNMNTAVEVEEATGSAVIGEGIRTASPSGQMLQPYREERVTLTQAQTNYAPYMSSYLQGNTKIDINGDKMTVAQAVASGNPALVSAAIASGRSAFFKSFGLSNYSRRRVVKALGQTVVNTDSQMMAGAVNSALKAKRDAAKAETTALAYEAGKSKPVAEVGQSFSSLSTTAWSSGAYASRADANLAVVKGMLDGMVARGDVPAIEALERIEKREGDPNTRLRTIDPGLFDKAKVDAAKALDDRLAQNNKDIKSKMFRELRNARTQQEKDAIIETSANALEEAGDYEGARKLRQDRNDLVVAGSSDYNAARLSEAIRTGEVNSSNPINEAVALGQITPQQGKDLIEELGTIRGTEAPKNKTAKSIADNVVKGTQTTLLQAFGLKRDAMGGDIYQYDDQGPLVEPGDAELILGQVERDIYQLTNNIIETNPLLLNDPEKLQTLLIKELNAWKKANIETKGGKYWVGDVIDLQRDTDYPDQKKLDAARNRFSELLAKPSILARPIIPTTSASKQQDFTKGGVSADGTVTPYVQGSYNPLRFDKVLTRSDVQNYVRKYEKGVIDSRLQVTAQSVGLSPLAFLQNQTAAYGLPEVNPATFYAPGMVKPNGVSVANFLISQGIPKNSAAMLSGMVQAESGFNVNREWGEVAGDGSDRNSGVISWNDDAERGHFRLSKMERRLGKKMKEASLQEQLTGMVLEIREDYPEVWRIVRNPHSTNRQLRRAMKMYIGWHKDYEGDRFTYAEDIRSQLPN